MDETELIRMHAEKNGGLVAETDVVLQVSTTSSGSALMIRHGSTLTPRHLGLPRLSGRQRERGLNLGWGGGWDVGVWLLSRFRLGL